MTFNISQFHFVAGLRLFAMVHISSATGPERLSERFACSLRHCYALSRSIFGGSGLIDGVLTAYFEIRKYDSGIYL